MAHLIRLMGVSQRFACRVTGQNRTTQRRPPAAATVQDLDAALRAWLRDWAGSHPRRGFRNAYHDARGEGWAVNHKKIQRLVARGRLAGAAAPPPQAPRHEHGPNPPCADAPDKVWAVDFQFDSTTDGRPVKIASIIDEHACECLGGLVRRSKTHPQRFRHHLRRPVPAAETY